MSNINFLVNYSKIYMKNVNTVKETTTLAIPRVSNH